MHLVAERGEAVARELRRGKRPRTLQPVEGDRAFGTLRAVRLIADVAQQAVKVVGLLLIHISNCDGFACVKGILDQIQNLRAAEVGWAEDDGGEEARGLNSSAAVALKSCLRRSSASLSAEDVASMALFAQSSSRFSLTSSHLDG